MVMPGISVKPKGRVVICIDVDEEGRVHKIDWLDFYAGGQIVKCMESYTGDHAIPMIGTTQGISLADAVDKYPYMAELIKHEYRKRPKKARKRKSNG
jgi:hypothetical protein